MALRLFNGWLNSLYNVGCVYNAMHVTHNPLAHIQTDA